MEILGRSVIGTNPYGVIVNSTLTVQIYVPSSRWMPDCPSTISKP